MSARDLDMVLSPDKTPLLDNVAITFKASPHMSTPLSVKTSAALNDDNNEFVRVVKSAVDSS
jgi:hypothetical protein